MIFLKGHHKSKSKLLFTDSANNQDCFHSSFLSCEQKMLVDGLVDPTFVISNANSILMKKLERFVDEETRKNFYMIIRAQEKLIDSINKLRNPQIIS